MFDRGFDIKDDCYREIFSELIEIGQMKVDGFAKGILAREAFERATGLVDHVGLQREQPMSISLSAPSLTPEFYDPSSRVIREFITKNIFERTGIDLINFRRLSLYEIEMIMEAVDDYNVRKMPTKIDGLKL